MNFAIIYSAEYSYDEPVADQQNLVRVRPARTPYQRLEGFDLSIAPAARVYEYDDYFGTAVAQFTIAEPHDRLLIRAESRVTTLEREPPPDPGWEELESAEYRRSGAEYLQPLEPAPDPGGIGRIADEVREQTPLATLRSLCELIPDRFQYRPGVTYVGSTVDDLLCGGAGVCQDFVHLAIAVLRSLGVATRYASGYLFDPNGDDGGRSAEVDTHAWVQILLPDGPGSWRWVAADPTNRKLAGPEHVVIGVGRHYSDVPPIRGVYRGAASSSHEASVTMTRISS